MAATGRNKPRKTGSKETQTEEIFDRDNVPGFERPMFAGPKDYVVSEDELGNKTYMTPSGRTYIVKRKADQRTTRGKVEDWLEEGMPLPSKEQVVETVKALPGAVLDSAERSLSGDATLGEAMGFAPAMGAASLPFKVPENSTRIFGGVRSKTAPLDKLPVKDYVRGSTIFDKEDFTIESPEDQWSETGWFLGPDGRARYEIFITHDDFDIGAGAVYSSSVDTKDLLKGHKPPNKNADSQWLLDNFVQDGTEKSFVGSAFFTYPLGKVVKNKELLEAYPDLETVPVVETPYIPKGSGLYSPDTDIIYLGPGTDDNIKRETLAHEIQHAVQSREAFIGGSSPEEASTFKSYGPELAKLGEQIQRLEDGLRTGKVENNLGSRTRLADMKDSQKNLSVMLYERVYGEEEARAVERRMGFTPEQRQVEFPEDSGRITRTYEFDRGPKLDQSGEKLEFAEGGLVDKQMNFAFMNEGGMIDDGQSVEPTTGNEIPPGSLSEEVADTVDAKLSEGEYVLPADVVQFYGLQKIEGMVDKAKKSLGELEAKDRIKGPAEEDDLPFSDEELLTEDGSEGEEMAFAEGGMVSPYGPNPASQGPGFETVIFVGPDGSEMPILFMNGQPVQQVPQGYVRKDQAKASGTFRSSRAATKPDDNYQPESRGKPVSEWDVEDFEKYANSQQMMDIATKLPALMGPFGGLAGAAMGKMYKFQGAQALEEIDRRMQGELDANSKERLTAVKTQIEENQKSGGGLFGEGEDSFLGQLVKGENPLEKLFGVNKPKTTSGELGRGSSAPRTPVNNTQDDSPQAPKTSPRPKVNPQATQKAVQETQKKQATVSSGTGSDKTVHSFEDNDPRSKGFADGGFVRRRKTAK